MTHLTCRTSRECLYARCARLATMVVTVLSLLTVAGSDRAAALAASAGERDILGGALRDLDELPTHADARTPAVGGSDDTTGERGVPELVYSNTEADFLWRPGAFKFIADDIFTTRTCGCDLDRYEFTVNGGGNGSGAGFTVEYALYDNCPSTGGQIIPGTSGTETLPDDDNHVVTLDPIGEPLPIPPRLWFWL